MTVSSNFPSFAPSQGRIIIIWDKKEKKKRRREEQFPRRSTGVVCGGKGRKVGGPLSPHWKPANYGLVPGRVQCCLCGLIVISHTAMSEITSSLPYPRNFTSFFNKNKKNLPQAQLDHSLSFV
jgi:hypothetical protein